ncbi:DUF5668 domain-containing protein [Candidatus Acetothermia bacterium]|jgi:uncharacterized membrane protein|nr:DUF5668 domain-containing protein [Candidatus Acetothermia bacterium]MCI2426738.1 DUF5668 domain-containing protein [Candidatus Acetothermia bacterium]MCI2427384.1 DUF5668 domain-containing protein [Candidatus Acetothermia bacterium]MCI2428771.1 DUF5668 domain-containing protein [Candidatus Acetothermia bacterium]
MSERKQRKNLFFPLILISGGIIFLLANLEIISWEDIFYLWPILLIIAGIIVLVRSLPAKD